MENASKALLMVAGVLIGLMIISLAVYLFASFGATSAEVNRQNEANQINQFNAQFTSYEGKTGVTIYDVITVANLATDNNTYYEFPKRNIGEIRGNDYYIGVYLKNRYYNGQFIENNRTLYDTIIENDVSELTQGRVNANQDVQDLTQYECKTYISTTTQRIYRVDFIAKNN